MTARRAKSRYERDQYFRPGQPDGDGFICGGKRKVCPKCQHDYKRSEGMLLTCPSCGTDRRCTAPVKRAGISCPKHRKVHTGNVGPANGNWKNGLHSRLFEGDKSLQARFQAAYGSDSMKSLLAELSVIHTRLAEVSDDLRASGAASTWKSLRALVKKYRANQDPALMETILKTIETGANESRKWDEVLKLIDRSVEVKKGQAKIERDRKAYLTAHESLALAEVLATSVRTALAMIKSAQQAFLAQLERREIERLVGLLREADDPESVVLQWRDALPDASLDESVVAANQLVNSKLEALVTGRA